MIKIKRYTVLVIMIAMVSVAIFHSNAFALRKGQKVWSQKITNANDKPAYIPFIGSKVVTIFYTDPDSADLNDPIADALKAKGFSEKYYKGIGIANCKDTWKPNVAIRIVVRRKIAKYKSTVLLDVDHTVKKNWGLGDCNNKSVAIIIGKDQKVKYVAKYSSVGEAKGRIGAIVAAVKQAIKQAKKKK